MNFAPPMAGLLFFIKIKAVAECNSLKYYLKIIYPKAYSA